ncbi:hypothetical protein GGI00_000282 [Coemansia sp. RSA 2681]|nr:hypothetical protein GGI00_000282 [Coemansia sp. RSA 2681]
MAEQQSDKAGPIPREHHPAKYKLEIDLSTMSPRSRRRHLSRISSARLRSRQRQHAQEIEDEIAKLEAKVGSLQQSIDLHRMTQQQDDEVPVVGSMERAAGTLVSTAEDTQSRIARTARLLCEIEPIVANQSTSSWKKRFYGRMALLNGAMNQLVDCIERVEALKSDISKQVSGIEKYVRDASCASSTQKHTSAIPISLLVNKY